MTIGGYAFSDCKDLIAISVPASVVSIGSGAFSNCNEALTIYAQEGSYVQEYVLFQRLYCLCMQPSNLSPAPESFDYDGTAREPAVTVTDGGMTLTQGTDYELTYTDNIEASICSEPPIASSA